MRIDAVFAKVGSFAEIPPFTCTCMRRSRSLSLGHRNNSIHPAMSGPQLKKLEKKRPGRTDRYSARWQTQIRSSQSKRFRKCRRIRRPPLRDLQDHAMLLIEALLCTSNLFGCRVHRLVTRQHCSERAATISSTSGTCLDRKPGQRSTSPKRQAPSYQTLIQAHCQVGLTPPGSLKAFVRPVFNHII
jgi:hypothetical protein